MNWPNNEPNMTGEKMDFGGRTALSFFRGCPRLMTMKHTAVSMPRMVIWRSPYLMPSRYSADRLYAEIRQFSAMIWYICSVVSSVQRPWRMMSSTDRMDGIFDVKGAAMEASPSLIISVSPASACSICCCRRSAKPMGAFLAAALSAAGLSVFLSMAVSLLGAARAPCSPLAAAASAASAASFRFASASMTTISMAAFTPANHSPRSCFSFNSCWYFSRFSIISRRFLRTSADTIGSFTHESLDAVASEYRFFSLSLASELPVFLLAPTPGFFSPASSPGFLVLASPKPVSRATPTWAAFSAPTSLVPSPHIRVMWPWSRSVDNTHSFCSGAMRANTRKCSTCSARDCPAAFSASPVTQSSNLEAM
mmetsp:Transcript_46833/g.118028  ORF Transcript_46833/g.118028 Transcript_46833/m.118028 type:complete len:366 (+) Transcript_46833:613-1710(+)